MPKGLRADRSGPHRAQFERNKKRILKSQRTCGICGQPVDLSLKVGDPMAPVIDHIIPVSKGGHPSDINNLQLAHWTCNRMKSDKLYKNQEETKILGNRNLPQSRDWSQYKYN
ncbi:MAG: HNH endonuclease signature motif containing protein [Aerococcus sp.]|nr:HNH endonuclease signature motif containing protein [Aerococcus sp.]